MRTLRARAFAARTFVVRTLHGGIPGTSDGDGEHLSWSSLRSRRKRQQAERRAAEEQRKAALNRSATLALLAAMIVDEDDFGL